MYQPAIFGKQTHKHYTTYIRKVIGIPHLLISLYSDWNHNWQTCTEVWLLAFLTFLAFCSKNKRIKDATANIIFYFLFKSATPLYLIKKRNKPGVMSYMSTWHEAHFTQRHCMVFFFLKDRSERYLLYVRIMVHLLQNRLFVATGDAI